MKTEIYAKIVKAAGIKPGDLVLVQYWMEEQLGEDAGYLQAAIAAAGATSMMVVQNLTISQLVNEQVTETTYSDKFFKLYEDADVIIDLMERPVGVLKKPLEPEKMALLGAYMQRLFATCASKKLLQLRVPTETMAKLENLTLADYRARLEAAMDVDYDKLKEQCEAKKAEAAKYSGIAIRTGDGQYAVSLSFGNRSWEVDAGDGDIPCGEIYIAPMEKETHGNVFFEKIYLPDVENPRAKRCFEKVVLTIEDGVIVRADQDSLTDYLKEFEEEERTICELGFGMNPSVKSLCGCAVLDEKMDGTFHLGIGDNTMFGGKNEAGLHVDLIGKGEYEWVM
ncbi:MAG: aminopeptidase [Lachnospiraceae bacterium]|nr:aminopeptidase [Lachnospiraceae bacterium]